MFHQQQQSTPLRRAQNSTSFNHSQQNSGYVQQRPAPNRSELCGFRNVSYDGYGDNETSKQRYQPQNDAPSANMMNVMGQMVGLLGDISNKLDSQTSAPVQSTTNLQRNQLQSTSPNANRDENVCMETQTEFKNKEIAAQKQYIAELEKKVAALKQAPTTTDTEQHALSPPATSTTYTEKQSILWNCIQYQTCSKSALSTYLNVDKNKADDAMRYWHQQGILENHGVGFRLPAALKKRTANKCVNANIKEIRRLYGDFTFPDLKKQSKSKKKIQLELEDEMSEDDLMQNNVEQHAQHKRDHAAVEKRNSVSPQPPSKKTKESALADVQSLCARYGLQSMSDLEQLLKNCQAEKDEKQTSRSDQSTGAIRRASISPDQVSIDHDAHAGNLSISNPESNTNIGLPENNNDVAKSAKTEKDP